MSKISAETQEVIDRWVGAIKQNGELFDRREVEVGFATSLQRLKLPARPMRWVENLEHAFIDITMKIDRSVSSTDKKWDAAWAAAMDAARDAAWDAARAAARDAAMDAARDAARAAAWAAARDAAWDAARDAARAAAWDAARAAARAAGMDAAWAAARDAARDAENPFAPLLAVARRVEAYWVMMDEVVCVPKPRLYRGERDRLHRVDGRAVEFPDGTGYWFFQGVRVTEQIILKPNTLNPEQILAERNTEVRRVMIERFGLDRFIIGSNAKVLDSDQDGLRVLYRIPLAGDEPIVSVRVQCPSTGQVYFLRVPPQIDTCAKAVAWTFGFDKVIDYMPLIET